MVHIKRQIRHFRRGRKKQGSIEVADSNNDSQRWNEVPKSSSSDGPLSSNEPRAFVIHRGPVGRFLKMLVIDLRHIMEPLTASRLKVLKRNNLKDFIVNGVPFGLTHLLCITCGSLSPVLRIVRCPQGPTVTFKLHEYTLSRDVVSSLRRPVHSQHLHKSPPLVVISGFTSVEEERRHLKLVQSMFQTMFPAINVDTIHLSQVRRCVLVSYDKNDDLIHIRQYAIKSVPSGLSRPMKKLVRGKVPDLSAYTDISEFFINPGFLSDSEFEGEKNEIVLSQDLKPRACKAGQQTSVRLIELGPRLSLSVLKIEEGIDDGEVLYHSQVTKTARELVSLRKDVRRRRKLKLKAEMKNELRIVRRLEAAAQREAEETDKFNEMKSVLIEKQQAVTGDYGEKGDVRKNLQAQSSKRRADDDSAALQAGKKSKRVSNG